MLANLKHDPKKPWLSATKPAVALAKLYPGVYTMDETELYLFMYAIYARYFHKEKTRVSEYQPKTVWESFGGITEFEAQDMEYVEKTGAEVVKAMRVLAQHPNRGDFIAQATDWIMLRGSRSCDRETLAAEWCKAFRESLA